MLLKLTIKKGPAKCEATVITKLILVVDVETRF